MSGDASPVSTVPESSPLWGVVLALAAIAERVVAEEANRSTNPSPQPVDLEGEIAKRQQDVAA